MLQVFEDMEKKNHHFPHSPHCNPGKIYSSSCVNRATDYNREHALMTLYVSHSGNTGGVSTRTVCRCRQTRMPLLVCDCLCLCCVIFLSIDWSLHA